MITLTYTTPSSDAAHLEGTWQSDSNSGTFTTPIIYVDGVQDIDATVEKMKTIQQQALDIQAMLGE
jgi:hypothetical protein